MAYNELLQFGVEGGVFGLLLFGLLYFCLIKKVISLKREANDKNIHYAVANAGILAFIVMGLVNFTIQAIPVMAVFIVYLGVVIKNEEPFKVWKLTKSVGFTSGLLVAVVATVGIISIVKTSSAAFQNRQLEKHHPNESNWRTKMDPLKHRLSAYQSYWIS